QRVSAAERAKQIVDERANAESRYQIGQMERVLEGAVEHGATITRDRLKSVLPPGDTLMNGENARARGFRLEGYGVFFDVIVPPFETETTLSWSIRTLDHSSSLGIGEQDWLTIAARANDDRPRLAPADSDARTRVIRLRGADLLAYLARQIPKEEARRRIEVTVY